MVAAFLDIAVTEDATQNPAPTRPAKTTAGTLQLMFVHADGSAVTSGVPTGGARWSQYGTWQHIVNGDTASFALFVQVAGSQEPASYALGLSLVAPTSTIIYACANADVSMGALAALDVLSTTNPDSASIPTSPVSINASAITTTFDGELVVWAGLVDWNSSAAETFTDPSGTTRRAVSTPAQFSNLVVTDFIQVSKGSTGTVSGTGTLAGQQGNFGAWLIAIRSAPPAGTTTPPDDLSAPASLQPSALYDARSWWATDGTLQVEKWFADELAPSGSASVTITTITGDAAAAGATALIDQQRKIATTTGDATAAGTTALVNAQRIIATTTGNAVANGQTASINAARIISTTTGNSVADGTAATVNQARTIAAGPGNAVAAGATAAIDQKRSILTTTGNAVAAGATALIDQRRSIATTTGDAVANGTTATINAARVIQTSVGNAVADGVAASISGARTIPTTTGDATAAGALALINQQRIVATTTGNAAADGAQARIDQQRAVATATGSAAADGTLARVDQQRVIPVVPGNASGAGTTASLITGNVIATTPGNADARGILAQVVQQIVVVIAGDSRARIGSASERVDSNRIGDPSFDPDVPRVGATYLSGAGERIGDDTIASPSQRIGRKSRGLSTRRIGNSSQ